MKIIPMLLFLHLRPISMISLQISLVDRTLLSMSARSRLIILPFCFYLFANSIFCSVLYSIYYFSFIFSYIIIHFCTGKIKLTLRGMLHVWFHPGVNFTHWLSSPLSLVKLIFLCTCSTEVKTRPCLEDKGETHLGVIRHDFNV